MSSLFSYGRAQLASVYRRHLPVRGVRLWGDATKPVMALSEGSLSAVIEQEIIPRLVAARPRPTPVLVAKADTTLVTDDVMAFAPMAITAEADVLLDFIDTLIRRGVGVEAVLVDLLAPTARVLGEYWENDRCYFVDVTMGLWRLQEIVHELSAQLPAATRPGPQWRALFSPMPGDQHSFGAILLDEIFAREGWFTDRLGDTTTPEILEKVSTDWYDLVGLTVGYDSHMGALPSLIAAVRNVSVNSQIAVMVGGRIFVEAPARAAEVGADGTAPDARLAVEVASGLVHAATRREFARG